MKIGCISWSYRNEFDSGKYDFFSWFEHCAQEAKLDGVELWNNHFQSTEDDYLNKLLQKSEEQRLNIYSVASKCKFGSFSESEIKGAKQTLRDWLKITDRLGVKTLRISLSGENERDPDHQRIIFESMTDVINEAKYPHITVGIENKEPSAVESPMDVALMNDVSEGKLKLILDNGSIVDKSTVYDFMEKTLPYADLVHAKFFDIDENGQDNVLDYNRIIPIIKSSDYDGFISIEYDGEGVASIDVPIIAQFLKTRI
jgi:sugar phosphate isomerase/epimerase